MANNELVTNRNNADYSRAPCKPVVQNIYFFLGGGAQLTLAKIT